MEIVGIALSIPAAFLASLVYCFLLARFVVRVDWLRRALWLASLGVLCFFAAEVALLVSIGTVRARARLGSFFDVGHLAVFFLGPPALANVLVLGERTKLRRWYWAVPICTLFAFGLVLLQYGVSEAVDGVDGLGPSASRLAEQPDARQ